MSKNKNQLRKMDIEVSRGRAVSYNPIIVSKRDGTVKHWKRWSPCTPKE
ncbi:MAG: hypothetical protein QM727_12505 [Niabella sp.]